MKVASPTPASLSVQHRSGAAAKAESRQPAQKAARFVYDPDVYADKIEQPVLLGSWDANGNYSSEWKHPVSMQRDPQGRWIAEVPLQDAAHDWRWGVFDQGRWAVFEEDSLKLDLAEGEASYAPSRLKHMGATRSGDDLTFRFWAPRAQEVQVRVWDGSDDDPGQTFAMQLDAASGTWSTQIEDGWANFQDKVYSYELVTSEGQRVSRVDPYAREHQGQQRGISQLYIDPVSGREGHEFTQQARRLIRFEVQDQAEAEQVFVRLFDQNGEALSREQLMERFGGRQQVDADANLVARYHGDQPSDHWLERIDSQGRIALVKQGRAWAAVGGGAEATAGLSYRFEVMKNGQLVGDLDGNRILDPDEARQTSFNDPYEDEISEKYGWTRFGVLSDTRHVWKNQDKPLQAPEPQNKIIYQMHLGSIFGSHKNVDRSTIKDVLAQVDYFKDLGVTDVELLPTDSTEKLRDWGYMGSNTLAVDSKYGFHDENGEWVSGSRALKRLVDAFRAEGIGVHGDVVYNHWGGRYNGMWNLDGEHNSAFNWGDGLRQTPWGAMPAYNQPAVQQFFVDHATSQLQENGYTSLRFDFTHPMHDQQQGGGDPGWHLLREINRQAHFFHPQVSTAAEEFPNHPVITSPPEANGKGGAGFDQMWNTQFNHVLIHDHGTPSVLQAAAAHQRTDMDRFMNHLVQPAGFPSARHSVTVINNHDEVGNADRIINIADHHSGDKNSWARQAARNVFGTGMLSPGAAIFFQGTESLADNHFSWGIPSTWDVGWQWREVGRDWDWSSMRLDELETLSDPSPGEASLKRALAESENPSQLLEQVGRKLHHHFVKDVIALRRSSPAFDGDAAAERVYTHNDNSVAAFTRNKDGQRYLVVTSFNHSDQAGYQIPEAGGEWQLVLNSDSPRYGGDNTGRTQVSDGVFDLPAGGLLVYRSVTAR